MDNYIGPLNRAETHDLAPGEYALDIVVTEDGRVIKCMPSDNNWLLIDGAWYEYRAEKPLTFGEDYPIAKKEGIDWNPLSWLPGEKPEIAPGYVVDFDGFTQTYRTLEEAETMASGHKQRYGGIGGSYAPSGWYKVRDVSSEEQEAIIKGETK